MRSAFIVLLLIPLSEALAARQEVSFERYQIIIDRAPFGSLPASRAETAAAAANQAPQPSFADSLRVSSIIQDQVTGLKRVCFVDKQNNTSYQFTLGDTNASAIDGVELISVDYDKEEVILQKGDERALIKLSSGQAQRFTGPTPPGGMTMVPRSPPAPMNQDSYAQRRDAMRSRMRNLPPQPAPAQAEPPVTPAYTGEALQKHLSEYKLDVIRQGLPALPIPLTQEEDAQLVKEGVLPPQP